jgi:geranylgeranyl pyrophosphate synthase
MNGFTVQPQTFEAILKHYAPHLQGFRDCIIADLKKTPGTAVLAGYFQGGKRFRALLAFIAASAIGIEPNKMIPVALYFYHQEGLDECRPHAGPAPESVRM